MKNKELINEMIYTQDFFQVLNQIQKTKQQAYSQVNTALMNLYWEIGQLISHKVEQQSWGKSVVTELAQFIAFNDPTIKGFSDKNLWRMKQFYETYRDQESLLTLVKKLPWTHNTLIFSRCKTTDERAFYLRLAHDESYSSRELERQINVSTFERVLSDPAKLSAVLRELHPQSSQTFKDNYVLEFLGLPQTHNEATLQTAISQNIKQFILEIGRDFIFIGEEYRLQVGNQDFYIDLLFFHRGLSALVAFELKIGKFEPAHLGQLNFYLEALDRDIKKPHENPSIGVLLCSHKDDEVVEYALNRSLSPALIAQYQTQLPDKQLMQNKLHELNTLRITMFDKKLDK